MTRRTILLLTLIVLKFLLQYFLIIPGYELHRDEYLHLDQGSHLAWGFLSVPPVTSWLAWVIQALGNGEWTVRFFPALFGALTILVVWRTVERLGGNLYACLLAGFCTLFSVLLRLNQLFQPNSLDVLCWTALYYFLISFIQTDNRRWLYAFAAVFAIGFLNKYNIAFAVVGLLPAILLTPQRKMLLNRHIYLALLLALLLISPNLIWQYQNNFPVFHHMKLLAETQLVNVNRADFLKEQLLFFMSAIFVIVAGLYGLLVHKPLAPYRLFFFSIIITLAVFTYLRAKSYYAIGIYPVYIAFGAAYIGAKVKAAWLRGVFLLIPIILFIPLFYVAFPNKTPEEIAANPEPYQKLGMLRWEDGKDHQLPQDFADMVGWRELAGKVDAAYASMPEKAATLVLCDNYGQAGAINYYSKAGVKAVSFNADYVNWFDLSKRYKHLIRVKSWGDGEDEMKETGPLFATGYAADSVTNRYAREWGTTVFVFRDARIDINARIEKEIAEERW
ncbi:Dolichyl-phosphate-mannose-protein mannosyltransferase [Dyadobacter soli]|uniref:Dolichyl-phosphate-mannose-protein mannosyltransferase n=1 Tax=Dyadobacter soli TaxID=659014 RepID=A0A1G7W4X4_9BACT|nr:glycosyltransferase family 39 protein [Dyadobacter soli]SDG67044.1 Dolichyl-phosphate-mannose-protein mannosyltransferase [Dyadobacter soli]